MNPAVRWLHGPEFEEIAGTCPWIARRPGSCGLRPPADTAPALTCVEKTDRRMSDAELRQTIAYTPDTGNENWEGGMRFLMWRIWEPVDGIDDPADRGPLVLGPSTSVSVLEKVHEPDDAALRKLLRLLKGEQR